jgi:hypothetical protein
MNGREPPQDRCDPSRRLLIIPFGKKYTLVKLTVLNVLALVAYDAARPRPAQASEERPAVVRSAPSPVLEAPWHFADADRDIGPGEPEPALCLHEG